MVFSNLQNSLKKTREGVFGKVSRLLTAKRKIDDDFLEQLEEILIMGDVGVETSMYLIEKIEERAKSDRYLDDSELENDAVIWWEFWDVKDGSLTHHDLGVESVWTSEIINSTILNEDIDNNYSLWNKNGTNLYYNNGNVWIWTTYPTKKLEVDGDIKLWITKSTTTTNSWPGNRLYFSWWPNKDDNTDRISIYREDGDIDQSNLIISLWDNFNSWDAFNPDKFIIWSWDYTDWTWHPFFTVQWYNWNVWIWTTDPTEKLEVAWSIKTTARNLKFWDWEQRIYWDNNSAFYMDSNNDTYSQIILRDKQDTSYGRIAGGNNWQYFWVKNSNNEWSMVWYEDSYT